jgi:Flp pilus assembly pilin Flp
MWKLIKHFVREKDRLDFAEYPLILSTVGVVVIAVIVSQREELQAAFARKLCTGSFLQTGISFGYLIFA